MPNVLKVKYLTWMCRLSSDTFTQLLQESAYKIVNQKDAFNIPKLAVKAIRYERKARS